MIDKKDSGTLQELSRLAKALAGTVKEVGKSVQLKKLGKDGISRLRQEIEKAAQKTKKSPAYKEARERAGRIVQKGRAEGERALRDSRGVLAKGLKRVGEELEKLSRKLN